MLPLMTVAIVDASFVTTAPTFASGSAHDFPAYDSDKKYYHSSHD
jgi:hypothetical protein